MSRTLSQQVIQRDGTVINRVMQHQALNPQFLVNLQTLQENTAINLGDVQEWTLYISNLIGGRGAYTGLQGESNLLEVIHKLYNTLA